MKNVQKVLSAAAVTTTCVSLSSFIVNVARPQIAQALTSCYEQGQSYGDSDMDESGGYGNVCAEYCTYEWGMYMENWDYYTGEDCYNLGCSASGDFEECRNGTLWALDVGCEPCC